MPKTEVEVPVEIRVVEARLQTRFARMQTIYDASKNISTTELREEFLNSAFNLDQLRNEYDKTFEKLIAMRMQLDAKFCPDLGPIGAFEELYCAASSVVKRLKREGEGSSRLNNEQSGLKLPPINLPTFDGNIKDWPTFFECYNSTVHNNGQLRDSDRVYYLKGMLSGPALTAVLDIPPTADNYSLIYNTLVDKYQDIRTLADSYLRQIFNMKPLLAASVDGLNSFLDKFASSVAAFDRLKVKERADCIFLFLALQKLDGETVRHFENTVRGQKLPSYTSLITFVKEQIKIIGRSNSSVASSGGSGILTRGAPVPTMPRVQNFRTTNAFVASGSARDRCPLCYKMGHSGFSNCQSFLKLSPRERYTMIKANDGCCRCLSFRHKALVCKVDKSCNICKSKNHHTMLHFVAPLGAKSDAGTVNSSESSVSPSSTESISALSTVLLNGNQSKLSPSSAVSQHLHDSKTVLLATARIVIQTTKGERYTARALLDSGSMNDFITADLCERLGLRTKMLSEKMSVNGFGGLSTTIGEFVNIVFCSRFDSEMKYSSQPLVVNRITDQLPTLPIDTSILNYLSQTPLADDTFSEPGSVEVLIGARWFSTLIGHKRIHGPPGTPTAFQTPLGFVLLGEAPVDIRSRRAPVGVSHTLCSTTSQPLDELLRSFWETEEVCAPRSALLSQEEQDCERIFKSLTTRDATGSYVVPLPFKSNPSVLGDSRKVAEVRLSALEKRFRRFPSYRSAYDHIMLEYCDKDYIAPVHTSREDLPMGYFVPHHGIIRSEKLTTKIRIVMDASASTESGVSLNDVLMAGPNLQSDLFLILINFRLFPVAICSDVEQMYLRIKVLPEFHKYQRMLYRFNDADPRQIFEVKRVCFGLTSSPYLALRTLRQLAEDEGKKYPKAAEIIDRGFFYMDDVCCSVEDAPSARTTALELINFFEAGGFKLHKFSSNSLEVLSALPSDQLHPQVITFDVNSTQKVLGVVWDPHPDHFKFVVRSEDVLCTKRSMLSVVARLWDVLGLAAPLILFAKLLIKELWLQKIDWDDEPPQPIVAKWKLFQSELSLLSQLTVPRHIGIVRDCHASLLGFSDASERAYGAVLYIRVQTEGGVSVRLLCAKSKVAPVKTVSLARLELMGLHLLSKLIRLVKGAYEGRFESISTFCFCDSTIVLNWVNSSPHKLKTFVANRISKIQENLDVRKIFHIAGKENPSDCLSRGLTPAQLISHESWLTAPPWAQQDISIWPIKPFVINESLSDNEFRAVALSTTSSTVGNVSIILLLAERISSWLKLLRTVVWVLRFLKILRTRGSISVQDLNVSEMTVIRAVQRVHFHQVFELLRLGKQAPSLLRRLRPFVVDGILRVGGRLEHSDLSLDCKHPILLPNRNRVTDLLIDYIHRSASHAGPQHVLSLIRQRFWVLSARRLVRARIHACVPCFRARPKTAPAPVMADLPSCRFSLSKPFSHTGVDYGGPFFITLTRRRGAKSQKAYLCVFVCLTTRAVHIELVTELSTHAFLNAFKRFLSRRGPVEKMFSDHGRNFVGAKSYLDDLQVFFCSEPFSTDFQAMLTKNRISWELIPPYAPHFGGSWEAAVKSFKSHLRRVVGSQILTYEELSTVLCQIEAVLNSRPLGLLSDDPSEPLPLTPAHFLNVVPLAYLPSAEVTESSHLLSRYTLLDQLVRSYWKRWSSEYVHTLQLRLKWNTDVNPVERGMIVLIQNDNAPPLHWPMGVITDTFCGSDGLVRVAMVRTQTGIFKRPVVRLCPLPSFLPVP